MVAKLKNSHKLSRTKFRYLFINRCSRRIMKIYKPEIVSDKGLWNTAKEELVDLPDKEVKVAMDRTHSAKRSRCSEEAGIELESSGSEKNLEENS